MENYYSQVICSNRSELLYVLEWAKSKGKLVSNFMWEVKQFPYHLFLAGEIVGWTDLTDRVGDKISFEDFLKAIKNI